MNSVEQSRDSADLHRNPADLPIPFGWYAVAYSDELKVGEVKPLRYFDKELVLFRNEEGVANVLDAFCPHLGAHLGYGGTVQGANIVCPFHGWQYNGGGHCTSVPYAKKMPPRLTSGKPVIHAYPTVERNQVIWAWYHPHRAEPTYEIPLISQFDDPDWVLFQRREWTFKASVQECAENPHDVAHFAFLHGPIGVSLNTFEQTFEGVTWTNRYEIDVPRIGADGNFDFDSGKSEKLILTTPTIGPSTTFPTFTGPVNSVFFGGTTPIDKNTLTMRLAYVEPKVVNAAQRMILDAHMAEMFRQVDADIAIWKHKVYLTNPLLCDGDGGIPKFRKWFSQFYVDAKSGARLTP